MLLLLLYRYCSIAIAIVIQEIKRCLRRGYLSCVWKIANWAWNQQRRERANKYGLRHLRSCEQTSNGLVQDFIIKYDIVIERYDVIKTDHCLKSNSKLIVCHYDFFFCLFLKLLFTWVLQNRCHFRRKDSEPTSSSFPRENWIIASILDTISRHVDVKFKSIVLSTSFRPNISHCAGIVLQ